MLAIFGRKADLKVEAAAWLMSCKVPLDPVEVQEAAGRDVCITVQYSTVKYSTVQYRTMRPLRALRIAERIRLKYSR